jgi:intracellular multiplication protein IcmE
MSNESSDAPSIHVTVVSIGGSQVTSAYLKKSSHVLEILDKIVQSGDYRVCHLLHAQDELAPASTLAQEGFRDGNSRVTAVFWTADGLKDTGLTAKLLLGIGSEARQVRTRRNLQYEPYTVRHLKASGFTVEELRSAGCTPLELFAANYTARDFRLAGYSAKDLRGIFRSVFGEQNSSKMFQELREAGYSLQEFCHAGYTLAELRHLAGGSFTVCDLKRAGYSLVQFREAEYTVSDLADLKPSVRELKQAGYDAAAMRAGGIAAKELKLIGYPLAQVKHAGYTVAELREAGYTAWVLGANLYSCKQLREGGFTSEELESAGLVQLPPISQRSACAGQALRACQKEKQGGRLSSLTAIS